MVVHDVARPRVGIGGGIGERNVGVRARARSLPRRLTRLFRLFCALADCLPRLASHMHVRKKCNTRTGAALYLSHSIESHCATIFWNSPNSTPLSAPSSLANFASTALHCSSVGFWPAFWSADFSSFVSM